MPASKGMNDSRLATKVFKPPKIYSVLFLLNILLIPFLNSHSFSRICSSTVSLIDIGSGNYTQGNVKEMRNSWSLNGREHRTLLQGLIAKKDRLTSSASPLWPGDPVHFHTPSPEPVEVALKRQGRPANTFSDARVSRKEGRDRGEREWLRRERQGWGAENPKHLFGYLVCIFFYITILYIVYHYPHFCYLINMQIKIKAAKRGVYRPYVLWWSRIKLRK